MGKGSDKMKSLLSLTQVEVVVEVWIEKVPWKQVESRKLEVLGSK